MSLTQYAELMETHLNLCNYYMKPLESLFVNAFHDTTHHKT